MQTEIQQDIERQTERQRKDKEQIRNSLGPSSATLATSCGAF